MGTLLADDLPKILASDESEKALERLLQSLKPHAWISYMPGDDDGPWQLTLSFEHEFGLVLFTHSLGGTLGAAVRDAKKHQVIPEGSAKQALAFVHQWMTKAADKKIADQDNDKEKAKRLEEGLQWLADNELFAPVKRKAADKAQEV